VEATTVYQFRDGRGILLYVGITKTGVARQLQHMATAEWYRYYKTQSVEQYDTREDAKARESWLIRNERPVFNRAENRGWVERRRGYFALFDTERLDDVRDECDPWVGCKDDEPPCDWLEAAQREDAHGCGDPTCDLCHSYYHGERAGFASGASDAYDIWLHHVLAGPYNCDPARCSICMRVQDHYDKTWDDSAECTLEHLSTCIEDMIEDGYSPPRVSSALKRLRTVAKVVVTEIRETEGLSKSIADSLEAAILRPHVNYFKRPDEVQAG
jgi:predicted GIY-YIG superfamily endonuclease